jgi:hypothetical protein
LYAGWAVAAPGMAVMAAPVVIVVANARTISRRLIPFAPFKSGPADSGVSFTGIVFVFLSTPHPQYLNQMA